MTVANGEGEPAGVGPPVDPFDPVALEARLAAARLRRRVALARRTVAGEDARPPAPATAVAAPPQPLAGLLRYRRTGVFAACALCLLLALPVGLLLSLRSAPASVVAVPPAKVTVGRAPVLAALVPAPAIVAVAAAPEPRPASHRAPAPGSKVARSARNGPRAITPPQAVRMFVRDVNAATLGTTAGALGLRERVAVPGAPLAVTLDRRGLRIIGRPLRHGRR